MTSLSCKKFKRIFTLKRGHQDQFICIQKNIKSAANFQQGLLLPLIIDYFACNVIQGIMCPWQLTCEFFSVKYK